MNILLLGGGGREHALAWKLAQSPALSTLYAAPGNPGIAQHARLVDLDAADHRAVLDFCAAHAIGLVVIGPEAPLVDGLADSLRGAGVPTLVVQGENDEYGTPKQVDAIVAGASGPAEALMLPGVGHSPHRDQPGTILAGLVRVVEGQIRR